MLENSWVDSLDLRLWFAVCRVVRVEGLGSMVSQARDDRVINARELLM